MIFFYKNYPHSFAATITNVIFRCLALVLLLFGGLFAIGEGYGIPEWVGFILLGLAVALYFVGNRVSDSIALKAQGEQITMRDALLVTEDQSQLPAFLNPPATITLCRDKAYLQMLMPIEYYMNGQPLTKLRNGRSITVQTTQPLNTFTTAETRRQLYDLAEVTVEARPGEHIYLHYRTTTFAGVERK